MKFIVILAAVLLTVNAAKVPSITSLTPVFLVEEIATVSEISKDHVVSTEVTPIVSITVPDNNVPAEDVGVQVGAVKVPLTQNPQVPETVLTQIPEVNDNVKKPVVETPMITEVSALEVTTTAPVDTNEVTTIVTEVETKMENDPNPCDLLCTKLEFNPVCAVNLDCIHEFPNHCVMETFNCLHPNKVFKEVKDERCKMHWLKKCTEKEMLEE